MHTIYFIKYRCNTKFSRYLQIKLASLCFTNHGWLSSRQNRHISMKSSRKSLSVSLTFAVQKPNLETPAKCKHATWLNLTEGPPFQCQPVLSLKNHLSSYKSLILASVEFSLLSVSCHARRAVSGYWSCRFQPTRRKLSDEPISCWQCHRALEPGMHIASSVPLYVCCSPLSLVSSRCEWCGENFTACKIVCLSLGNIVFYWAFFYLWIVKKMILL